MDFLGALGEMAAESEVAEASNIERGIENASRQKELERKYDRISGFEELDRNSEKDAKPKLSEEAMERKYDEISAKGDFFVKPYDYEGMGMQRLPGIREPEPIEGLDLPGSTDMPQPNYYVENQGQRNEAKLENDPQLDLSERREPNSKFKIGEDTYETDDEGKIYKKNGELLPDNEYTANGSIYRTDGKGRIVEVDSKPEYTKEGSRDLKEQREAGGGDRQEGDDGGHLLARMFGGSEGDENLVPMRRTINRGDYKKMELEIAEANKEGKDVKIHIDIEYDDKDSKRPSKIIAEYEIDGKRTVVYFDNIENSSELLDALEGDISDEDYERLETVADSGEYSITSVKKEYDENGNVTKVTVGMLDESSGEKTYKVYEPRS